MEDGEEEEDRKGPAKGCVLLWKIEKQISPCVDASHERAIYQKLIID